MADMNNSEDERYQTLNDDPHGRPIYHSAIGQRAWWGGWIGGIFLALVAWLIASGTFPIAGLGQLASARLSAVVFFGFSIGSAIGGLVGSVSGIKYMLFER